MQIKVAKTDLEKALQVATIGVGGSGSDLSAHFLFRIKDKGVEILSFNQRICANVPLKPCEFEGEDGDMFTLEGKRITAFLGAVGDVALTLEKDGSEIRVSVPRGSIHVGSLDPAKFPFWDKTFGEAESVGSIASERLGDALAYAKNFISDKETTRPEIAQVEIIDGLLWATDAKAVTLIALDGMDKSNLRIHRNDIASVAKFLSLKETEEVEILEHERDLFLRRDEAYWEVNAQDVLVGIQRLSASADWENTILKFAFDAKAEKVVLGVQSASGRGEDVYAIDCIEHDGMDKVPDEGFEMEFVYIKHIVGHFSPDTLRFGINRRNKGGYVRFRHESGKDSYLTVAVWKL